MAGDVEVFNSSVHDTSISSGFRALYEERLLLDVTLVIEDHHFQAHKALLATQSDYFRIMFTADMRERDQDEIHLKGLTATGFSRVLQFMYYGTIELGMATIHIRVCQSFFKNRHYYYNSYFLAELSYEL